MFEILRNHESRIVAITRILLGLYAQLPTARRSCSARSAGRKTPSGVGYWGAGPIELFGGFFLIAAGLFTRIASFLTSGLMASAYFIAHAPQGFWPILNGGATRDCVLLAVLFLRRTRPGRLGGRQPSQPRAGRTGTGCVNIPR